LSGEYHEDCNKLMTEVAELQARVAELEACMMPMMIGSCTCCTKTPVKGYHRDTCRYKVVGDVLNRKPRQSLLLHDAEVLEGFLSKEAPMIDICCPVSYPAEYSIYADRKRLHEEADKLRKKAEE